MDCIVTAGPTFEPLDQARRLTNFSSGRLGTELAAFLHARGHRVTLLLGEQATWGAGAAGATTARFSTTADLSARLESRGTRERVGIFHAAAVSDFAFGQVWRRSPGGELAPVQAGKLTTRDGPLLAELLPTPKIIARLRGWFPNAVIVGWKYEVDGGRESALAAARAQITDCRINACVANGPAYGTGFGLVTPDGACAPHRDSAGLYEALAALVTP